MIKTVLFFANGNVAVFNEMGDQCPQWQTNVFLTHLNEMENAGVLDRNTTVTYPFGGHKEQPVYSHSELPFSPRGEKDKEGK